MPIQKIVLNAVIFTIGLLIFILLLTVIPVQTISLLNVTNTVVITFLIAVLFGWIAAMRK